MTLTDELYQHLEWRGKWVFSISDVERWLKRKNSEEREVEKRARNLIHSLKRKGLTHSVRKGLYALIPFKYKSREFKANKFHVAQGLLNKLGGYGYISHHSALELHGAAESAYNKVHITMEKQFKTFEYGENTFQRVKPTAKSQEPFHNKDIQGMDIKLPGRGISFVDCLNHLSYAGGLDEFIRALPQLKSVESEITVPYTLKHGKFKLNTKVGLFLTILNKQSNNKVRKKDLEKLKENINTEKTYYLQKDEKNQKHVPEWNLIVPQHLYKLYREGIKNR